MKNVSIKIDTDKIIGKIKPMHAIGQPPKTGLTNSLFHYLKEAGIPYSRLHDVGGWLGGGLYVDIPNLFRDFDADENDPESYDFTFTDTLIQGLVEVGCEPYFRLGVTIENEHKRKVYRIFPPKDPAKWARICEHVIRHYREGWADGFHYNITYWEIWNEPDDCYTAKSSAMWKGTPEQYYELYSVTAKHLKKCFGDSIKVGGYGHCGLYDYDKDPDLEGIDRFPTFIEDPDFDRGDTAGNFYSFTISFMHEFFRYQKKTGAPIDFFSWHVYNRHETTRKDFRVIANHAQYCRNILDKYGYTNAEHHLNEWNLWTYDVTRRDVPNVSSRSLAFMLMMQNTSTDIMCFYDAGIGYSPYRALINSDTGAPYRNYYAFSSFNTLYQLKNQVFTESDDEMVFVGAARQGKRASVVISNVNDFDVELSIDIKGISMDYVQIHRIDEFNRYTKTGESLDGGVIKLPANGCIEIDICDLQ